MKLGMIACVALAAFSGWSKPMMPQSIPGDRLIKNLEARLAKEPGNAEIYYLVGRAHYATYSATFEGQSRKQGEVRYFPNSNDGLPRFSVFGGYVDPWEIGHVPKNSPDNIRHIIGAVQNLQKSISLNPKNSALAHLTLACTFESASPLATSMTLPKPNQAMKTSKQFLERAAQEYVLAFDLSVKPDLANKDRPIFGLETLISFEAARSYLRIAPHGSRAKEAKEALVKFEKMPNSGIVTPLIFDLNQARSLNNLLDSKRWVKFDLNGTGLPQSYTWVKSTTAFLVWDPEGVGRIDSGRRLFGSSTWWMLWANAYEALNALDNDRDGWLQGPELKGLAVWIDRNQSGVAESGEVIPIGQTQIEAIRTRYDRKEGRSFVSEQGIRLKSGQIFPSYDWVTKSLTPMPGARE